MNGLQIFTLVHVAISLIGILTGFVVVGGMIRGRNLPGWTRWFLMTTVLTSVTGFFFPIHGFTPGLALGIISLVVLAVAYYARCKQQMAGGWRKTYVATAVLALYLNVFVLIAQSFQKIPALHALAPTQADPPFKIVQGVTLVVFVVLGILAGKKFMK